MIELPPGPSAVDLAAMPELADLGALGTVTGAQLDPAVLDYTASIRFDWKLYRHDIAGSIGHVRMLARWKAGEDAHCVEFDLAGTACEDVICEGRTVFAPKDADAVWPLEGQYERRSYLGLPCFDSSGRVIGHIACADDKPMREELPHHAILKIFSMRAAIEMERAALDRNRSALSTQAG